MSSLNNISLNDNQNGVPEEEPHTSNQDEPEVDVRPYQDVMEEFIAMCSIQLEEDNTAKEKRYTRLRAVVNRLNELCPKFIEAGYFTNLVEVFKTKIEHADDWKRNHYYSDFEKELQFELSKKVKKSSSDQKENKRMTLREKLNRRMQIKKQRKTLQDLMKEDYKYNCKELSIDDLDKEETTFTKGPALQKKILNAWDKLCKLEGHPDKVGKALDTKFLYNKTPYDPINKAITSHVNKMFKRKTSKQPKYSTPNFEEIHNIVEKTMKENKIFVPDVPEICKDILKHIVFEIRRRRVADYLENQIWYEDLNEGLDEGLEDDEELNNKLNENAQKSAGKIDTIIDKFVVLDREGSQEEKGKEDNSSGEEEEVVSGNESDGHECEIMEDNDFDSITGLPENMANVTNSGNVIKEKIAENIPGSNNVIIEAEKSQQNATPALLSEITEGDSKTEIPSTTINDKTVKQPFKSRIVIESTEIISSTTTENLAEQNYIEKEDSSEIIEPKPVNLKRSLSPSTSFLTTDENMTPAAKRKRSENASSGEDLAVIEEDDDDDCIMLD